jgi:hypothetical protein
MEAPPATFCAIVMNPFGAKDSLGFAVDGLSIHCSDVGDCVLIHALIDVDIPLSNDRDIGVLVDFCPM